MTTTPADLEGFERRGAAIRRAGGSFFDNPYFLDITISDFDAWCRAATAWGSGWLREDAGRTPEVVVALERSEVLRR